MANENYKIIAQVELDTSQIQKQLSDIPKKIDFGGAGSEIGVNFQEANMIMRKSIDIIGDMVEQVYALDDAVVEFRKVSDLDGGSLDRYVDKLGDMGDAVARTTSEMVQAATEFKKSGFTDEDSATLAGVASMLQNVADGELSAGEASNFIISQLKAFGDEFDKFNTKGDAATHVIDALNAVSNNFAVSSTDLSTNIGKASAALAVGNNTYEETLGLLTGITEITRNASRGARGLVSVQSRLNQITDETSSTGKKLTAWYKEHNIEIYDQEGQLRSLYDILSDLAPMWDTLTTNEKDYYLNTQAGANQSVNLAAALDNFDTVLSATETAYNSAGSAAQENARYMESLEAKTQQLKSTFQDLSNNVIDSQLVKSLLDLANNVLKGLNTEVGQTITQWGLLTGLFTGVGTLAATVIPKVISSFTALATVFQVVATGAGTAGEAIAVFGGGLTGIMPVIAAVAAAVGIAGVAIWNATEDYRKTLPEIDQMISDNATQIESNKARLEEINEIAWYDRTPEIEAERQALEKENAELQDHKEKLEGISESKAWDIIDGAQIKFQNSAGEVVTVEENLIAKANELTDALKENGELTDDQIVEYNQVQNSLGQVADAYVRVGQTTNDASTALNNLTTAYSNNKEQQKQLEGATQITIAQVDMLKNKYPELSNQITYLNGKYYLLKSTVADVANSLIQDNGRLYESDKDRVIKTISLLETELQARAAVVKGALADYKANRTAENEQKWIQAAGAWNETNTALSTLQLAKNRAGAIGWLKSPGSGVVTSGGTGTGTSTTKNKSYSKRTEKETDKALEVFKDHLKDLKHEHEMGLKSDEEYYDGLEKLIEEYKKSDKANLQEMYQYEEEVHKGRQKMAEEREKQQEKDIKNQKEQLKNVVAYAKAVSDSNIDQIDNQLDEISDAIDVVNKKYDKQVDALEKANNQLDKQIQKQQLLEALAKAKSKRQLVYKNSQFQYVGDSDAVAEAQSALDEFDREDALAKQKEFIEEQRQAELTDLKNKQTKLKAEKKQWEEYKKGWEDLTKDYSEQQDALLNKQKAGIDIEKANWNERLENLKQFKNDYNAMLGQVGTDTGTGKEDGGDKKSGGGTGYHFDYSKTPAEFPTVSADPGVANPVVSTRTFGNGRVVASRTKPAIRHATGTLDAPGGLSLVGEQGPELRVLNSGDGIIPSDVTKNLWAWGSMNPAQFANSNMGGNTFTFGNISLPGVTDAQSFVSGIRRLAYQRAYKRA